MVFVLRMRTVEYLFLINNGLCKIRLTNIIYQAIVINELVQFDFSVTPISECAVHSVEVGYESDMANIFFNSIDDYTSVTSGCSLRSNECSSITSIYFVTEQRESDNGTLLKLSAQLSNVPSQTESRFPSPNVMQA